MIMSEVDEKSKQINWFTEIRRRMLTKKAFEILRFTMEFLWLFLYEKIIQNVNVYISCSDFTNNFS